MTHRISIDDALFLQDFESLKIAPAAFDHAAHVRLAYIYLCGHSVEEACQRMKQSLLSFLAHLGVDQGKYHETITRAWIMAVDHFRSKTPDCNSAREFVDANGELLDSKIMLTHYSASVLFSPEARRSFVQPDIQSIPPR